MSSPSDGANLSSPAALSAGHGGTPGPRDAPDAPAPRLDESLPAADRVPPPDAEEVDVWWGAYSGWTMLPSFLACLALTGLLAWGAWLLVPPGWFHTTVLGLGALLWAVQASRWLWRVLSYHYRLTNRRLFQHRSVALTNTLSAELADVVHVALQKSAWDRLVGVGRIRVQRQDGGRLVLEGVRNPARIAELIRDCVHKARERKADGPGA
jgi:hypothetical protein